MFIKSCLDRCLSNDCSPFFAIQAEWEMKRNLNASLSCSCSMVPICNIAYVELALCMLGMFCVAFSHNFVWNFLHQWNFCVKKFELAIQSPSAAAGPQSSCAFDQNLKSNAAFGGLGHGHQPKLLWFPAKIDNGRSICKKLFSILGSQNHRRSGTIHLQSWTFYAWLHLSWHMCVEAMLYIKHFESHGTRTFSRRSKFKLVYTSAFQDACRNQ